MQIKELLERKGIKVIRDYGYGFICDYKGNEINILHNDANINSCYTLYINGKTIMTRALITTVIGKILNLKESE